MKRNVVNIVLHGCSQHVLRIDFIRWSGNVKCIPIDIVENNYVHIVFIVHDCTRNSVRIKRI